MQLIERPRLELSGAKLKLVLEDLVARSEEQGGVEAYVEALRIKCAMFQEVLQKEFQLREFRALCAHMSTVRRRIGQYAQAHWFGEMKKRVATLLDEDQDTDERIRRFCAAFPDDREHRWARDLAAELLHHAHPERYPLMTRWVWDARTNTGVLRELWHGDDVDGMTIDVPDSYATFLVLREELAQYLSSNGVFRDVLLYVDVLMAQVYAGYIGERGGTYLRADFTTPEDPMLHTRRILGLDGIDQDGRSRLKAADGRAEVVE
jgi:hypothetical protein